jgi:hypothetical protein
MIQLGFELVLVFGAPKTHFHAVAMIWAVTYPSLATETMHRITSLHCNYDRLGTMQIPYHRSLSSRCSWWGFGISEDCLPKYLGRWPTKVPAL